VVGAGQRQGVESQLGVGDLAAAPGAPSVPVAVDPAEGSVDGVEGGRQLGHGRHIVTGHGPPYRPAPGPQTGWPRARGPVGAVTLGHADLLPRWEIDNLFPGLASREMAAAREGMVADISRLGGLFDRHDVRGGPSRPVTSSDGEVLDRVLAEFNAVLARLEPLEAYIYALVTTDARDDAATAALTGLQADLVALDGLRTRLEAWVGRLGAPDLAAAASSGGDYLHLLERAAANAAHQMAEGEEGLLAELRLSGSNAWSRLAGDIGSTLEGTVDGQRLPVTVLRGRATDPDRAVRHAAYRAELVAWESVATPLAACLNGVKGEAVTVNRRRSWSDALAPALQANGVDAGTLAAMQSAAVATFPHFRRFLRAKARLLSPAAADAGLAWWDLVAPVPGEATVDWSTAAAAVTDAFGTYSSRLGDHARRAIDGGWVAPGPAAASGAAPTACRWAAGTPGC